MNYLMLSIPLLSMLLGWAVIRMACWLMFRPVSPIRVFGIRVQGLLPARQQRLARDIGAFASDRLSGATAADELTSGRDASAAFERVKPLVEAQMDDFLRNRLKEQMPMIEMFIGDKTIASLKEIFIREIESLFPQVLRQVATNNNIATLIEAKISAIPAAELELLIRDKLRSSIRRLSLIAAIVGLVIGLLQLAIVIVAG